MDVFAAIAQPTRRSILEMLAEGGELTVSDIASRFRISPPAISQHLKILREARLVRMHKNRQQRIYEINPEAVRQVDEWVRNIEALWSARFDRLDELLKEEAGAPARHPRGRRKNDMASQAASSIKEIVVTRELDAPREACGRRGPIRNWSSAGTAPKASRRLPSRSI